MLNRGRHLYSAGQPSRWEVATFLVIYVFAYFCQCIWEHCYHSYVVFNVARILQFKIAIVVMGRPKYLPDDGDHVLNLDDFQPPHWQGRSRSFDGTFSLIYDWDLHSSFKQCIMAIVFLLTTLCFKNWTDYILNYFNKCGTVSVIFGIDNHYRVSSLWVRNLWDLTPYSVIFVATIYNMQSFCFSRFTRWSSWITRMSDEQWKHSSLAIDHIVWCDLEAHSWQKTRSLTSWFLTSILL